MDLFQETDWISGKQNVSLNCNNDYVYITFLFVFGMLIFWKRCELLQMTDRF